MRLALSGLSSVTVVKESKKKVGIDHCRGVSCVVNESCHLVGREVCLLQAASPWFSLENLLSSHEGRIALLARRLDSCVRRGWECLNNGPASGLESSLE